jgi:hypothetical protein
MGDFKAIKFFFQWQTLYLSCGPSGNREKSPLIRSITATIRDDVISLARHEE